MLPAAFSFHKAARLVKKRTELMPSFDPTYTAMLIVGLVAGVIALLRRARNEVVWKLGEAKDR